MAWIEQKSIAVEDSPHVHWAEGTIQEIRRANAAVVDRLAHLSPEHPEYIKKGDAPAGLPIPFPDRPFEASIKELHGPLPDAISSSIVNERIRLAVERLEPDTHQFIPTIVTLPDGTTDESWWAFRRCHRVDAIALQHCEDVYEYRPKPEQYPNWFYYRSNEGSKMRIVVQKGIIAGMATWYDWRFQKHFFSEELGQYFMDSDIRGYRLPAGGLNRSNHAAEI